MLAAYIFSLVVGGGLLTLSLFGDLFGAEVDAEAGIDIDVDADGIGDGADIAKLLSLRALVYALFGFGGSGLFLHWIWGGGQALLTGLIAGGMGVGAGALVSTVFGYLKRTEAGEIQGEAEMSGLTGKVLLPIGPGETGEVRVTSGDRRYRVRARADDESGPDVHLEAGRTVMVVEVKEGVARVAPVKMKLLRDE